MATLGVPTKCSGRRLSVAGRIRRSAHANEEDHGIVGRYFAHPHEPSDHVHPASKPRKPHFNREHNQHLASNQAQVERYHWRPSKQAHPVDVPPVVLQQYRIRKREAKLKAVEEYHSQVVERVAQREAKSQREQQVKSQILKDKVKQLLLESENYMLSKKKARRKTAAGDRRLKSHVTELASKRQRALLRLAALRRPGFAPTGMPSMWDKSTVYTDMQPSSVASASGSDDSSGGDDMGSSSDDSSDMLGLPVLSPPVKKAAQSSSPGPSRAMAAAGVATSTQPPQRTSSLLRFIENTEDLPAWDRGVPEQYRMDDAQEQQMRRLIRRFEAHHERAAVAAVRAERQTSKPVHARRSPPARNDQDSVQRRAVPWSGPLIRPMTSESLQNLSGTTH